MQTEATSTMADDSWFHAVPFGLVMFVGTALGFGLRSFRRRAARASFPELGRRLGLEHTPAETAGAAGVLKGTYQGFGVRVESETRARVVVLLRSALELDLRNYDRWVRLPPGLEPFAFADRARNTWLKTRLASVDVAALVTDDTELERALDELHHDPALREVSVCDGRVELVFDFGARGLFPVDAAQRTIGVAVRLAQRLSVMQNAASAQAAGV